jgi:hypothetical protein
MSTFHELVGICSSYLKVIVYLYILGAQID